MSSGSTESSKDPLPKKSRNWRTLVLNANSIAGKIAQFSNLVDYTQPDAIPITKTKLGPNNKGSEFMPPGYSKPFRKDRKSGGGGVLVAVKDCYTAVEVEQPDTDTEIMWVQVSL